MSVLLKKSACLSAILGLAVASALMISDAKAQDKQVDVQKVLQKKPALLLEKPGEKVGLNPQPEPPTVDEDDVYETPGEKVGLNPQPEPPTVDGDNVQEKPGEKVGLNPQPEPPTKQMHTQD